MSIRTPFNPLGTLGAVYPYVQPVMKQGSSVLHGITDESYPYTFKMTLTGDARSQESYAYAPFDTNPANYWGVYATGTRTRKLNMSFEKQLLINGMEMTYGLFTFYSGFYTVFKFYGLEDGEDPTTGGTLLGEFEIPSRDFTRLSFNNRRYYKEYRLDITARGKGTDLPSWAQVKGITLDAYYKR